MSSPHKTSDFSDTSDLYAEAHKRAPSGCFCHYTAVAYHGLTNQIPQRVYIRKRSVGNPPSRPERLSDLQIRTQFLKPHRRTGETETLPSGTIVYVAGKHNDETGILSIPPTHKDFPEGSRITDLERCLIDAVVAPQYNGGLLTIPGLFEEASEKLDLETLIAHYQELDFLYPYHQAIGFFLDHCTHKQAAETWRTVFPPSNRFFVDKNAKSSWELDPRWQVYYPKGLVNAD